MPSNILSYIIYSSREIKRKEQVKKIQEIFPSSTIIDPIFPEYQKVPFLKKIIQKSKDYTGKALLTNEVGVFLSHRKVWQAISKSINKKQHYLVLESDSKIVNAKIIKNNYSKVEQEYDLFFWGAWNNHVSIKKSSRKPISDNYIIGEPLIKSLYGAYGYSLNAETAQYLLSITKKIYFPVDLYKQYIDETKIKIGAIKSEVIGTWQTTDSNVRKENQFDKFKRILIIKIFHTRNQILAYFC